MPDMPPAFYAPMTAALVTVIGVLWRQLLMERDKREEATAISIRVLTLNSEALRANTEALEKVASNVQAKSGTRSSRAATRGSLGGSDSGS